MDCASWSTAIRDSSTRITFWSARTRRSEGSRASSSTISPDRTARPAWPLSAAAPTANPCTWRPRTCRTRRPRDRIRTRTETDHAIRQTKPDPVVPRFDGRARAVRRGVGLRAGHASTRGRRQPGLRQLRGRREHGPGAAWRRPDRAHGRKPAGRRAPDTGGRRLYRHARAAGGDDVLRRSDAPHAGRGIVRRPDVLRGARRRQLPDQRERRFVGGCRRRRRTAGVHGLLGPPRLRGTPQVGVLRSRTGSDLHADADRRQRARPGRGCRAGQSSCDVMGLPGLAWAGLLAAPVAAQTGIAPLLEPASAGQATGSGQAREVLAEYVEGLSDEQFRIARRGEAFFNTAFVPAPGPAPVRDGLGPLLNSA